MGEEAEGGGTKMVVELPAAPGAPGVPEGGEAGEPAEGRGWAPEGPGD